MKFVPERVVRAGVAALALVGCQKCGDGGSGSPSSGPALAPLASSGPALEVTGFGDAVIHVPAGTTRPRPIVVAVLGIGDTPEEQCAAWREIVGARAFVLCPRGTPNMVPVEPEEAGAGAEGGAEPPSTEEEEEEKPKTPPPGRMRQVGFLPVDLAALEPEVTAGLAAVEKRFGAYVAGREAVYVGFSRGAFLGASLAARHPERFRRLVLIEGGHTPWQKDTAAAWAKGGGARVLFACGQPSCVEDAEIAASTLRDQRVETRIVHAAGAGHDYRKQMKDDLRRAFDWVIEGDPSWRGGP